MKSASIFLVLSLAALGALASGCRGRVGSIATCTPGEPVMVGCTSSIGRACSGDPTLTICDARSISDPETCSRAHSDFINYNDDSGGTLCPYVTFTCPASGSVAINPNPWSSSSSNWSCEYAVVRSGI